MSLNLSIKFDYPDLPVVKKHQEFLEALKKFQVLIVESETGSGKSTQLPKFLLESGIYKSGKIGVTEPRRLAALSIADRLREELHDETLVSSKIRFFEEGKKDAPLKVMTDGILLQEFRTDKMFSAYSAILIDEAHERSLNIDILLGILKSVLKVRKNFKVVIASATMDTHLFQDFFENSYVLKAEGKMFPVQVEYQDPSDLKLNAKGDSGLLEDALLAISDLMSRKKDHLLCFLPTERDIQDLSELLKKELDDSFEILPLFGRMSPVEQKRIFKSTSKTRIVLSTNIAETSLTIPGIAYVVDSGLARISRYNSQSRIQGLLIEEISKASANQRKGRAGRVKPGICIRLYSEKSFSDREDYTDPEIRRSNLANVVLQLKSLDLNPEAFDFIQAPLRSAFRSAYKLLYELDAIDSLNAEAKVTPLGRSMAKLPMDATLAAVLLKAKNYGVLQPAIIVCAALSIQDPRVYPQDEKEKEEAKTIHKKFGNHKSDFLVFIAIWNEMVTEWNETSWNKLRKFCEKNYLHFLRCKEWIDLFFQYARLLKAETQTLLCPLKSFHRDNLHKALLGGFLGGIAKRNEEKSSYRLVNGREAFLFPGSDLIKKQADFILSAEVRETSRVYLTKNVAVLPEWIIEVAGKFCTKKYFAPAWNKVTGFVEAIEEISFKGIILSRSRKVNYEKINREEAAEIFFREAVVNMDMLRPFPFMLHNEKVLSSLAALETRTRKFGLLPSEETLVYKYMEIAPGVTSLKTLKDFILKNTDASLKFRLEDFLEEKNEAYSHLDSFSNTMTIPRKKIKEKETPMRGGSVESIRLGNKFFKGELVFDATKNYDGLTLYMPSAELSRFTPARFYLEIKHLRYWLIESFFREVPKNISEKKEKIKEELDSLFCDMLEAHPDEAPVNALFRALEYLKYFETVKYTLNPEKEFHLNLHLKIQFTETPVGKASEKKSAPQTMELNISPEWGNFHYLQALKEFIPGYIFDLPFENFRYGFRENKIAVMENPESLFYKKIAEQLAENKTETAVQKVIHALTLLESFLKIHKITLHQITPRTTLLKLFALDVNEKLLPHFSESLFQFNKQKIQSFADLQNSFASEKWILTYALFLMCYESGLLGFSAFAKSFSEVVLFLKGKQEKHFVISLKKISQEVLKAESAYEILFLANQFFSLNKEIQKVEAFPLKEKSPKIIRERFREFLVSKNISEEQRKDLQRLLSALEKTAVSDNAYLEIYIQLQLLKEEFLMKRLKTIDASESETIEISALKKLQEKFKS